MIKATLVLALGLVVAALLRRRPAALRHRVLAAALVCSTLMPLAEMVTPGWRVPLLRSSTVLAVRTMTFGDGEPAAVPLTGRAPGAGRRAVEALPFIWAWGSALGLLALAAGLVRLARTASRARPIGEGAWTRAAALLSERCGMTRPPVILQAGHPAALFTWGIRRPRILLPLDAEGWPEERIRIVLGHELAHIRRGDWLLQLLADAVRCAYWFNPLVWIACRRLRLESEHACDDEVLRLGVAAPDYAAELLRLAAAFRGAGRSFVSAPAMSRPSDLERRVRFMLNPRLDRSPVRRSSVLLAWTGMLVLTLPLAGLSIGSAGPLPAGPTVPTLASSSAAGTADHGGRAVAPPEGRAQLGPPATIAGTVTDQSGRPVPHVPVRVTDPSTSAVVQATTDRDGRFAVANLAPGRYELRISKPGFKTITPTLVLRAGDTGRADGVLQLAMLSETIIVSTAAGAAPVAPLAPPARRIAAPPAHDPCAQSAEGGCVTPPIKLAHVAPLYPAHHAQAGVSGEVVIDGVVRTDGSVGALQPRPDSDPDFAAAAMHAIRLWTFSPTRLNGEPVEVQMAVRVKFQAN